MTAKGIIAAGSQATAEAGAEMFRRGGNAVDAAVAGCFATSAGEPSLTSLAGAGLMLYRNGKTGEMTICDFFADAPGLGGRIPPAELDFSGVELDFGPTTQTFYIGAGSSAVPGVLPGICQALERWGSKPLAEIVEPAIHSLTEGAVMGPHQARAAKLLEPILSREEPSRKQYCPHGHILAEGERFISSDLADTLKTMASMGWREFYEGRMWPMMLNQFGLAAKGTITEEDLKAYSVRFYSPLEGQYRGSAVYSPGAPATGGQMIELMMAMLNEVDLSTLVMGSAEHTRTLALIMQVADEARAKKALGETKRWVERFGVIRHEKLSSVRAEGGGNNSTTHISTMDSEGNAASVTFSYGEGNAHLIGNTGIMMNNLMGEEDLHPQGFHLSEPGKRLSTMMSPTMVVDPGGKTIVIGTGGANRIRTVIVQMVSKLMDYGMAPKEAVAAARIHYEEGVLNAEVYDMPCGGEDLMGLGANELICFSEPSLFFGGVHMVQMDADGELSGAADGRRGGVCIVS
jgi:gamma-glutamyltranspeptidase / glutathione hydrolase